jgi:hypothetical protein|tara:strand:- start:789 stop:1343 length:555 start_codon:yes stop_codon:yes gene_type:complete
MSDEKDKSDEIEDDVLGSDSDVQHIDNPHVNEWLKADDNGFRPTPQQEKFRQLAYRMALRKRFFRGEWYKATKAKEYQGVAISERTWARWCKEDDRFVAWFYDEFPDTAELSEEEFKMMDMQYWTGVRDAMSEGEEWAYRQYAKTRFDSAAAKKEAADTESLVELRAYFDAGGGDSWKVEPGEA